jgi:hypothetical protein
MSCGFNCGFAYRMSKAERSRQQFNIFDEKLPVIGCRLVDDVASKLMRI